MIQTGGKFTQYHCSYCHVDITQQIRIKCAECADFDLCADCFCSGVELLPHKPSHSYRVVDSTHFPIFSKDWTLGEELLLLEGIEKHGLGNWKNISEYIGTKAPRACGEHYMNDYLGIFGDCLPPHTLHADTVVETQKLLGPSSSLNDLTYLPSEALRGTRVAETAHSAEEDCPGGEKEKGERPSERGRGRDNQGVSARREQEIREKLATLPGSEIAGYMPLRQDFDIEHLNGAEEMLVEMEFNHDDHPAERAMKLKVIGIYNTKLTERDERKKFVIERGVIDVKKQQQADKKRSKEERDLLSRMKIFSRFLPQDELDTLLESVVTMRRLKKQIDAYKTYRAMGIRTTDQARKFETERRRREYQIRAQKSRQSSSFLGDGLSVLTSTFFWDRAIDGRAEGDAPPSQVSEILAAAPGAPLLSPQEMELCQHTSLMPLQYLAIQEAIVREAFRNGTLTPDGFRRVVKCNPDSSTASSLPPSARTRRAKRPLSPPPEEANGEQLPVPLGHPGLSASAATALYDFFVERIQHSNPVQGEVQYAKYLLRHTASKEGEGWREEAEAADTLQSQVAIVDPQPAAAVPMADRGLSELEDGEVEGEEEGVAVGDHTLAHTAPATVESL